jgi:3D-(3,5/4)-trihydroxycyclohexane-1,2-dione acylhydrolase (decyclizing)
VCVETDPLVPAPDGAAWWDVAVAEVSTLDSVRAARKDYADAKRAQRTYLTPTAIPTPGLPGDEQA